MPLYVLPCSGVYYTTWVVLHDFVSTVYCTGWLSILLMGWENIDLCMNALDNAGARIYSLCFLMFWKTTLWWDVSFAVFMYNYVPVIQHFTNTSSSLFWATILIISFDSHSWSQTIFSRIFFFSSYELRFSEKMCLFLICSFPGFIVLGLISGGGGPPLPTRLFYGIKILFDGYDFIFAILL